MKKIAYIEIDNHHAEVALSFMEIMEGSQQFSVDYYFSEKIKKQVGREGYIFVSDSSMIIDQLKEKKYDLIVIGTVHRFFNTFQAIVQRYNTAVIAHNLNFVKASKFGLFKNIFKEDMIYRLKLWLKEGLFCAPKVYETAKLLVLDESLLSEEYQFLPIFYNKNFDKTNDEVLTVVIPGGVSQKRRDYKKVISKIKELENQVKVGEVLENKLIEFVFLGKVVEKDELKEITDLERALEYVNITYFTERVSQTDFEKWMNKADVLWCPIQRNTRFFSQKEVYGLTKMTGNIGDAIKYGKMAVFPADYHSELGFIVPEQKDVMTQFQKLKTSSFDFQTDYNKATVQAKLEKILEGLISI